ncbi:YheC/YheD family protein [Brevibacillus choshinensis]|uniref:YheC/YheD family protein n=1 Tax=Brevibacillus choshinensis TaxID=54911 RepID=A0ABX7FTM9_BRECH|nr:YheC/YheD family protein [Brevibacillus choshinensis]QRG69095.1 YheC/YheD family protein [Brevibacillus choshinensis]
MISSCKWSLHKFFAKSPHIHPFLPPTSLYQPALLQTYLGKYDTVYIKPTRTHMGKGIIRVQKEGGGYQFVKERGEPVHVSSLGELQQKLEKQCAEKKYIIQKGIDLAELNGRPYDIRVMMMRNGLGKWQYAGMLAKVAGSDSIITNVARGGGYAVTVPHALEKSLSLRPPEIRKIERSLIRLSYQVCSHFNKYRHSAQIGVDFAVNKHGEIVLIEVNYDFPSHGLFAKLKDKTYFRTIKRLHFQYRSRVKRKKSSLTATKKRRA